MNIIIREPRVEDKEGFLEAMRRSQSLHCPWVTAPLSAEEFDAYLARAQLPNHKRFLLCNDRDDLIGVFNISDMVHGVFQSAYLGFYAVAEYAGLGLMSSGLKLVLRYVFEEVQLHRLEANIQPENTRSIQLVKSNGFRYEGFSPRYLKIQGEWRGHEHWVIGSEDYIRDRPDILQKDKIGLEPYNPEWPLLAQIEIDKIRSLFPKNIILDIQHMGSTAIPGLSAKPILDIQIAVASLDAMELIALPILQKLGYEYWDANPDPEHLFFVKGMPPYGERRTHHVHIYEQGSAHWSNKLIFRDYLRSHAAVAKEYEQVKQGLAKAHLYDREKYTDEKLEFVKKVLQMAK